MSGFSGINNFGSLTTQNGTKVDYKYLLEKYDADGNGEISKDEFNTAIKEEKLDKVELSKVNTNGDEVIDEKEMGIYEQKYKMQEAVNAMSAQITKDFSGNKSQYIAQVTLELTNYITEFANNYQGEVSGMAEAFSKKLPTKYTQIKKNVLANEPSSFKSQVLDDIVNKLQVGGTTKAEGTKAISDTALTKVAKALETEANKYIKANPQCNESELKAHLEAFLNQTDADKMKSAAETFKANAGAFGTYIDGDELVQLKEYAKNFLTEAVNNGVTVKLGTRNIATTNAITTALKSYTDGAKLKADMETAIANLNTVSKKDTIVSQAEVEELTEANKKISSIKGSAYKINSSTIDYSNIDGYFDGSDVSVKKKKKVADLKSDLSDKLAEQLEKSLKPQMKEQIQKMLQEKGIPFENIEQVFENIYNTTFTEVFNSDGMVSSKHKTWLHRGKASVNVKNFVDNFITTFNTNIAKAIDEMNKSNKDFDTIDIDFTQAGKDENGNAIKDETTGADLSTLYATGKTITTKKHGADYYVSIAEKMIDRMKSQMLKKAKAMCNANGVTFDESAFQSMFNNAKSIAVNTAVNGISSGSGDGVSGNVTGISMGAGAAVGGTLGATVGIIGAIPGAAIGGIISGIAGLFTGHHSKSSLNTKTLLDTFAENFKQNYSNWVEAEANKAKNK